MNDYEQALQRMEDARKRVLHARQELEMAELDAEFAADRLAELEERPGIPRTEFQRVDGRIRAVETIDFDGPVL